MQRVRDEVGGCVEALAQVVFGYGNLLYPSHFLSIIKLSEEILSETNLLELELLLEELCRAECPAYLDALFLSISSNSSNKMKE